MKRIELFNWIRDIPYSLPLSSEEPDYCCLGKHKILEKLFKGVGLEVRPRLCDADWSSFNLPPEIEALPHDEDILHVYLEVNINGKWKQVDASVDKGLALKFPLAEWDGYNSTELCIGEPKGKIYSPKKSLELYMQDYEEDFEESFKFYSALNSWLDDIRQRKV